MQILQKLNEDSIFSSHLAPPVGQHGFFMYVYKKNSTVQFIYLIILIIITQLKSNNFSTQCKRSKANSLNSLFSAAKTKKDHRLAPLPPILVFV